MQIVTYARTSINGNGGDSADAQEDACRDWAAANGHEVVAQHRDEGLSGRLGPDERPGLAAALLDIEATRASGLIVHRLDRLARELHVQEAALARVWSAKPPGRVFEAVEGEVPKDDPKDPMRTFVRQVMGAAAQLERGMIVARMQGGRSRKHKNGGYAGGPTVPFGQRVEGKGRHARRVDNPDETAAVTEILQLRGAGLTLQDIANRLNDAEIPTPRGGRWHVTSVVRVLRRWE
ncbi:MAG: recombinase family protein [Actinomycetota bacterium]|nr:recombinase family protein [Actinomycetota bacterium]